MHAHMHTHIHTYIYTKHKYTCTNAHRIHTYTHISGGTHIPATDVKPGMMSVVRTTSTA